MPIPHRAECRAFLSEFAASHAGVRLGRLFGRPAGYVGRRLFAYVLEDGLVVRLPADVARQEFARNARPYGRRGRPFGCWVQYRPRSAAETRRLAPVLELAARHVAERQGAAHPSGATTRRQS